MRNGFFEDTDILAADLQAAGRALMTNGVLLDEADALKVIAAGGMKVAIKTGTAWLNGAYVTNEATAALTLTTADGVLNRIDRIVIRRDDIQGQIYGVVLTGVAAATPIPPAIVRDGTYYDLCLATINIPAGTTTITDAMITDNRGDATLCPVACARTGILAKIETKADKTYCDDTFALKTVQNSIVGGTTKTNAQALQGKAILATAPTVGQVLQFDGTQYKPIDKLALTLLYSGSQQSCGIILTDYAMYTLLYVLVDVNGMTTGFYIKPSEITGTMDYRHIWGKYGLLLSTQFRFVPTASNTFGIETYSMSDGNTYGMGIVKIWGLK